MEPAGAEEFVLADKRVLRPTPEGEGTGWITDDRLHVEVVPLGLMLYYDGERQVTTPRETNMVARAFGWEFTGNVRVEKSRRPGDPEHNVVIIKPIEPTEEGDALD